MTLDELRNLDPKDMGNWPRAAQIGLVVVLVVVVLVAGYFLLWSDQMDQLAAGQQQEEALKTQYLDKAQKAANLEAYKQQLKEIQDSFGVLLRQLPTKSEMETLLTEINQAGVGRGLQFDLFRPQAETKTAEFAEMPIDIRITGSYHDLSAFVSDVAQLSRIVTLTNIELSVPRSPDSLSMAAVVKTYRALDDSEQQQVRQAEADAKKRTR
ncbi:type 4a pilus biogenesis protein PilO [Silvimonas iriomotensis]|uniref:Type 4 fimbrial biogenesis protein PilO n=1 Tax=Silvimonas iriomotensis TaxID=449662 RepID=A0ABQ2PEC1_9NEIS|nr:type 4a pilus biogenesis protein PilO [Silvimonas iriomotensis]GGP23602.1 type 4 fimbrial biogenesis protein PilO [Silvimonas iriomotensis]